jgi:hypothetical protein
MLMFWVPWISYTTCCLQCSCIKDTNAGNNMTSAVAKVLIVPHG